MKKVIEFCCYGANGYTNPEDDPGSGQPCSVCSKPFSRWDDLNLSPTDKKLKCAKCKGIEIKLIYKR